MSWPWAGRGQKIGELKPEVGNAIRTLTDVLPEKLRLRVAQEIGECTFQVQDEFVTWHPPRKPPHLSSLATEVVTPIAGFKYQLESEQGLCELIARHGIVCELAYSHKVEVLQDSTRFTETELYSYSEAQFHEIDSDALPDCFAPLRARAQVLGITGQEEYLRQLQWRLQTVVPQPIYELFLSWGSVKLGNFRMDGVFCTRNFFVPGRNEFVIADVNDCARMLAFNEGDTLCTVFGRDQIDGQELAFGHDIETALAWLLETDLFSCDL